MTTSSRRPRTRSRPYCRSSISESPTARILRGSPAVAVRGATVVGGDGSGGAVVELVPVVVVGLSDTPTSAVVVACTAVVVGLSDTPRSAVVVGVDVLVDVDVRSGRTAGGSVVGVGEVSRASAAICRGRSRERERLRRPTGSDQAVAIVRRQPSGWVSAHVCTLSGASRLPPRRTMRLTASIRAARRRAAVMGWRAYRRRPRRDRPPTVVVRPLIREWSRIAAPARQTLYLTDLPFGHWRPIGSCQYKGDTTQ